MALADSAPSFPKPDQVPGQQLSNPPASDGTVSPSAANPTVRGDDGSGSLQRARTYRPTVVNMRHYPVCVWIPGRH
jgi:hypothetical protein